MRIAAICTGSILLWLTGCTTFPPRSTNVPLAAVIHQLREDFKKIKAEDPVSKLALTNVQVVLKVSTENVSGIAAATSVPLTTPLNLTFTNETTGTMENTVTVTFAGDGDIYFRNRIRTPLNLEDIIDPKKEGPGAR